MKMLLLKCLGASLLVLSSAIIAETKPQASDSEILAQRGSGVVTQVEFAARADRIPSKDRYATLRDSTRFRNILNNMLLQAQLAADAREAGFDKEQIVKDRMRLAAEAELAAAWLQHYIEIQPEADYDQSAREYYELNKQNLMSPRQIDVSHILISTSIEGRSDEEARQLAESISQQIANEPVKFDELVIAHSEDPSAQSNQGKFYKVKSGDMVKPFEDAAFSLSVGAISKPVKTQYGYHIIRLDKSYEPEIMGFEEVREQLVDRERGRHDERIKGDYLNRLSALDVHMTEEALEEMVRRQFADDEAESPNSGEE